MRGNLRRVILERSMHPQFLSNTYLIADREGGTGAFVDAGGPVEPLIEAADRHGVTPTHILLTHHHWDHVCEVDALKERWPDLKVLIHPDEPYEPEHEAFPEAIAIGDLEIRALHTPGHTAGMLALVVDGNVFTGDTLFKNSVGG